MQKDVNIKPSVGGGLSGKLEKSKAIVNNYTNSNLNSENYKEFPSQRSLRETNESKKKLAEHLALRSIKLKCEELKEKLHREGKYSKIEIETQVQHLAKERFKQYKAEKIKRKKDGKETTDGFLF